MKLYRLIYVTLIGVSLLAAPAWGSGQGESRGETSQDSPRGGGHPYRASGRHMEPHGRYNGSSQRTGHYTAPTGSHRHGRNP